MMVEKLVSVGRAATHEMMADDQPLKFTASWQASAIAAGRRAGLTDAEIEEMTGFAAHQPDDDHGEDEGGPGYGFG